MAKRTMPISLYPVCFTVAIIAITLIVIGQAGAATTDIEQAKKQIVSLINSGRIVEADASIDKFIADTPISREKGTALQQIAGTYQNAGQADRAIKLCDYIFLNWPKESFAVWAGMSMTLAQFDKGDVTAAESTIQKMVIDYASNENLAPVLWVIADTYSWQKMYERAGRIYIIIAEKFPDSPWAAKAREGIKGMEILRLIENADFSTAKEKTDSMIAEFSSEPNLPDVLLRIGQEISWRRQYGDSKYVLDRLIELYPLSLPAQKAKLWSARAAACGLIKDKNNDDALEAIDKMISDFDGNPELADSVRWISKECEWTNGESFGKADRYDAAGLIYQRLQKFSNPDVAKQAEWDQKRMAYRTKILTLMDKGDENEIDIAINQMTVDLAGRPELANDLFWIATWYQQYHKPDKGMALYERIAVEFPGSNEGKESVGRAIFIAIEKEGDINAGDNVVNNLRRRLQGTPRLATMLYKTGDAYSVQAEIYKIKNDQVCEKACLEKASNLYNEAIKFAGDSNLAAEDYLWMGRCYNKLHRYLDAINCYKKINEKWPGSKFEADCLENMGTCYEELTKQGHISPSQSDAEIEKIYKKLAEKYPDRPQTANTIIKLGWLKFAQGELIDAISWFEKGLTKFPECCKPTDVLYALGRSYQQAGQNEKAVKVYEELLKVLPESDPRAEKVKQNLSQINGATNQ